MKKLSLSLVCALALILGSVAAHAETTGIYVAPKFMMMWQNNYTDMDVFPTPSGNTSVSASNSQFTLGGALAVGYDFYPQMNIPVRAEIEFAMRGNNEFSEDTNFFNNYPGAQEEVKVRYNANTLLANFYWDFHNDSAFTPYVMAGAGLAFINAKYEFNLNVPGDSRGFSESKNYTNFAWAVGAGCAYNLNENLAVDLGYRYLNLGTVKADATNDIGFHKFNSEAKSFASNHEIMLGLRYTF